MGNARPIYLDYHATTPVDPRVLEAMLPTFTEHFGNAASTTHAMGWEAEALVEQARERVAALIGAEPREIFFTSGATESNNLALRGAALRLRARGNHIVTMATEHSAVLDPLEMLEREGFQITRLAPRPDGLIDLDALREALTDQTILVSVMAANNEIGTIQPLDDIGALTREAGALLHTDAAQAAGKVPLDVQAMQIDLLTLTAHKMCGPKGVGAIFVRRRSPRVTLEPMIFGGGHEGGLRSGTLNVPGIVGLGKASEIASEEMSEEAQRVGALRDHLLARLREGIDGIAVNGTMNPRLPGNLNVSFPDVKAETLLTATTDLALSTGSACTSAEEKPSHVLQALGLSEERIEGSIRFGLGRFTTEEEVDRAADRLIEEHRRLRALSPTS